MLHSKGRLALGLIFFLFCYVYLWIIVKPHLIYHGFGTLIPDIPMFATRWAPPVGWLPMHMVCSRRGITTHGWGRCLLCWSPCVSVSFRDAIMLMPAVPAQPSCTSTRLS